MKKIKQFVFHLDNESRIMFDEYFFLLFFSFQKKEVKNARIRIVFSIRAAAHVRNCVPIFRNDEIKRAHENWSQQRKPVYTYFSYAHAFVWTLIVNDFASFFSQIDCTQTRTVKKIPAHNFYKRTIRLPHTIWHSVQVDSHWTSKIVTKVCSIKR